MNHKKENVPFCRYNVGVQCSVKRCSTCGFNPVVNEKRLDRVREGGAVERMRQIMRLERVCEVLDPHNRQGISIEVVDNACLLAIDALKEKQARLRKGEG